MERSDAFILVRSELTEHDTASLERKLRRQRGVLEVSIPRAASALMPGRVILVRYDSELTGSGQVLEHVTTGGVNATLVD